MGRFSLFFGGLYTHIIHSFTVIFCTHPCCTGVPLVPGELLWRDLGLLSNSALQSCWRFTISDVAVSVWPTHTYSHPLKSSYFRSSCANDEMKETNIFNNNIYKLCHNPVTINLLNIVINCGVFFVFFIYLHLKNAVYGIFSFYFSICRFRKMIHINKLKYM